MWVERVGEFEQNFQSVESFALAEVAELYLKNRWQLGSGFFVALF